MTHARTGGSDRRRVHGARHRGTMAHAWLRRMTPGLHGDLPRIVVIGVQRGGTTSLFDFLCAHREVVEPLSKELNYFSLHHQWGQEWYRGHFPRLKPGQLTIEASPLYLLDPRAPARAAAELPETHFVAVLRDPTERAYSHYLHNLEHGLERLSFADALAAEPERLARAASLGLDDPRGFALLRNSSYVLRGRYAEHLRRWQDEVPADRLHVVRSEELFVESGTELRTLMSRVGVALDTSIPFPRANHWEDDAHSQLTAEVRHDLDRQFAEPNADLTSLLGWSRTWARSPAR